MSSQKVAVLGASPKKERYSNRAVNELAAHGHQVFPVHPKFEQIDGHRCYPDLAAIPEKIDTLTLYVGAAGTTPLIDTILSLKPARIIMNPGAENDELEQRAQQQNIEVVRGCTLVMLRTEQF